MKKKIFAVSDIHGHCTLLKEALKNAGFERDNPMHLLVCCGDYFDRGNENLNVLKFLDVIDNKVLLRGNHEDMLLDIFNTGRFKEHNYLNGTVETIVEFFGKFALDSLSNEVDFSGHTRMLDRATDFIMESKNYFETERYVFTHGWLPTVTTESSVKIHSDWRNASAESWKKARWTKWHEMYDVCDRLDGKTIVCGHVPSFYATKYDPNITQQNPDIFYGDGVTVLDAGTYTTKRVNVLMIEDEEI